MVLGILGMKCGFRVVVETRIQRLGAETLMYSRSRSRCDWVISSGFGKSIFACIVFEGGGFLGVVLNGKDYDGLGRVGTAENDHGTETKMTVLGAVCAGSDRPGTGEVTQKPRCDGGWRVWTER